MTAASGLTDEPVAPPHCGAQLASVAYQTDAASVYQATYEPASWSGSLAKFDLTFDTHGSVQWSQTPKWEAGSLLTGSDEASAMPHWDARKIYTGRHTAGASFSTVEFRWDQLSNAQKALLNASPLDGKSDKFGENRLNYLRGQRSLELGRPKGIFRTRKRVLGDIVHSLPVYVGSSTSQVESSSDPAFLQARKSRAAAVYVGANDGMLHAFDATSGHELFAYAPEALLATLNQLPRPDYAHRAYIDGAITVADAFSAGRWRTVLAAGMRGGARGLFALDVTRPEHFIEGGAALWEFTSDDDADIGRLTAAPLIAKFRHSDANGHPAYAYFVVAAAGVADEEDAANDAGKGKAGFLFLLSLDKSPAAKWKQGVNYYKFTTSAAKPGIPNALGMPALALDGSGAVRHLYVGDLQGQLWHFDFAQAGPWGKTKPAGQLLFTASDADGNRQPITMQPRIVFAEGGGHVLLFGTGRYLENADVLSVSQRTQSFYGVVDAVDGKYRALERRDLLALPLVPAQDVYRLDGEPANYRDARRALSGWYIDFPGSASTGERALATPQLVDGNVAFNSFIPRRAPCGPDSARLYLLDALTGVPTMALTGIQLPPGAAGASSAPQLRLLEVRTSERNAIGGRSVRRKYDLANSGGLGGLGAPTPVRIESSIPAGRLSWREIVNWQELHDATDKK